MNEASRPSHHILVSICKFNPVSNFGTPQHHVTHIKTHSLSVCFLLFLLHHRKMGVCFTCCYYDDSFELSMCKSRNERRGFGPRENGVVVSRVQF